MKEGSIRGIIGIVNVTGLNFLAVITDAVVVGELNNVNIWRVSKVRFLAFKEGHLSTECVKLLDASKIMLEDGFKAHCLRPELLLELRTLLRLHQA